MNQIKILTLIFVFLLICRTAKAMEEDCGYIDNENHGTNHIVYNYHHDLCRIANALEQLARK